MDKRKNVILCGFMGSGKSTVGKFLSRRLGMQFIDMDAYIEDWQKTTISEIFAAKGETEFRRLETQAARDLSAKHGQVIAAGGGTLLFPQNVEIFRKNGVIVLLDAPLAALQERLKNDRSRPLLQKPNRNEVIRELHEKRMPLYRAAADFSVNAGLPPKLVAEEIIRKIELQAGSCPVSENPIDL